MNESEIQKGKIKYNNLVQKRDKYRAEKNILIKKAKHNYFLKNWLVNSCPFAYSHYANYGNDRLANMAFSKIAHETKDSKEIYVFMGFLDKNKRYAKSDKKIKSAVFTDLETVKFITIDYDEYNSFISNNKVIYSTQEHKFNDKEFYIRFFAEMRMKYLASLIHDTQNEAIQKILK